MLLVVVTLAAYSTVSRNGFVNYDDDRYVVTNQHLTHGLRWSTLRWALTSFDEANWHPVTWLSHALDYQLFRLNPLGHHYTSLLLHVANTVLVFLLLAYATGKTWRSLMVAALFAVHPINVESVAWVAERKTVLAMFFVLLTLSAYGWYVRKPGIWRYIVVAALFVAALMSKPMAITLPCALLLLDYWPLQRMRCLGTPGEAHRTSGTDQSPPLSFTRLFLEKTPLLALSACAAILTEKAQKAGGAVSSNIAHPPLLRLENAAISYVQYIAKTLWPSHLAALYPYPKSIAAWEAIASTIFLLAATVVGVRYREHRYLPFGWFWFMGTMVPMIGLVQVGNQAMADRYAYLPVLGLCVMFVWAAADCIEAFESTRQWKAAKIEADAPSRTPISAAFLAALAALIIVALAMITRTQVTYWHDDLTLWTHALAVTRSNFVAENNVGAILARQGRYEEAVVHFRTASSLEPADPVSQLNLGIYAQQHGDMRQAIVRYNAVLQLATDTRFRASAYANLGQIYFAQRDYPRARQAYEAAAELNDTFPLALALLAQKAGDWNEAVLHYAEFASAQPSDVAFLLLAQALQHAGREQESRRVYEQAERVSSDIRQAQQTADHLLDQ